MTKIRNASTLFCTWQCRNRSFRFTQHINNEIHSALTILSWNQIKTPILKTQNDRSSQTAHFTLSSIPYFCFLLTIFFSACLSEIRFYLLFFGFEWNGILMVFFCCFTNSQCAKYWSVRERRRKQEKYEVYRTKIT